MYSVGKRPIMVPMLKRLKVMDVRQLGLTLLCGLMLAGCGESDAGFTVTLPEGWTAQDEGVVQRVSESSADLLSNSQVSGDPSQMELLAVWVGPEGHSINVVRDRIPAVTAGEAEYLRLGAEQLKQLHANILQRGPGPPVDGEPSYLVDYVTSFQGSPRLHLRELIVFHNGYAYNITLSLPVETADGSSEALDSIASDWVWTG